VPALVCFLFSRRPLRFVLGLAALRLAGTFYHGEQGRALYTERSFFGVHRVTRDPAGRHHFLIHGNTLHGQQSLDAARRAEPLTYYHRTGPIGQILATFGADPHKKIAAVGLGAGSLAAYAAPGCEAGE
jgi:tRNA A58 N-methylase Trm61